MALWRDDPVGALLGVRQEAVEVVVRDEHGAPVWRYRHERPVVAAGACGEPGRQATLAISDGEVILAVGRPREVDDAEGRVLWRHACAASGPPRALVVRDDIGDGARRVAVLAIFADEAFYVDDAGLTTLGVAGASCGDISSRGDVVLGTSDGVVHHGCLAGDRRGWRRTDLGAAVTQVRIAEIEGPHRLQIADEVILALAGGTVWNVGTRGEPVRVAVRPGVDLFYLCTYGGLLVLRSGAHELELVSATEPAGDLAFAGGRIAAMAVESVHEEEVLRHQSQAALVVYVEPESPRDDVTWARIRVDLNQASGGAASHRVGAGVEAESPDWLTVGGEIDRARINEGYRWGDFEEPEDEEVVASLERRLKEADDPKALVRIIELPTIIEGIPHLLRAARALEPHLRHRDPDVAMAASRRMGSLVRWMRYYPVNTATHQAGSHREDCGPHENEIAAMEAALEAHHRRESRLGLMGCTLVALVAVALIWWLL